MSVVRLLIREIGHRKLNFALGVFSVVIAVAGFVAVLTMSEALDSEATRLMRDMGFNVNILPKGTDMMDFWSKDFAEGEMPEVYVDQLAESKIMTVNHLVATLQKRIDWRGRSVLLTGVRDETPIKHRAPKPVMQQGIPQGSAWVGSELASSFGIKQGDKIEIEGKSFEVIRCLDDKGSAHNISVFTHLHDAQELAGTPGKINIIQAIGCRCQGERLATIRKEIAEILPDTEVIEFEGIATARAETRDMIERYAGLLIPLVLLVAAVWIGLLALSNVRQRSREIGTLRAVGWGSGNIAGLILGKAVLLGLLGAGLGFAAGSWLVLSYGPEIFHLTAKKIAVDYTLLGWVLIATPIFAALASFPPALAAVLQDPAVVLCKE